MDVYDILLDFGIASFFILVGQLLRAKVSFFQKFFMPASMIAGLLGLLLGPHFANLLTFSDAAGDYTGLLMLVIFAVLGINGFKTGGMKGQSKETVERFIGYSCYRFMLPMMQYAIGIFAGLTVIKLIAPEINDGFGLLLAAGFNGGHGTAATVSKTFADLGWAEAGDIAMTTATLGMLFGIFGGLAQIKMGTRKGWTGYIKDFRYASGELKTGLIPKDEMAPMGNDTISSVSLDSLCYHLSLVVMVTAGGYLFNKQVIARFFSGAIPDYCIIYIIALLFFICFHKTGIYQHMDTRINNRISGTATDYLVFFGVARINTAVVVKYALPLIILILVGVISLLLCAWLCLRMVNKSWFEHYIFCYGYNTGIFAIGFVLLRIVDPDNKSHTLEDVAITPWGSFIDIFSWSLLPFALVNGQGWLCVLACTLLTVAPIVLSMICKVCTRPPSRNVNSIKKACQNQ